MPQPDNRIVEVMVRVTIDEARRLTAALAPEYPAWAS